jgi:acyl-CoA-binding protein
MNVFRASGRPKIAENPEIDNLRRFYSFFTPSSFGQKPLKPGLSDISEVEIDAI